MTNQDDIKKGIIQITKSKPMTYQLLRFLHSQGVVIKVEDGGTLSSLSEIVAVDPLVEE